MVESTSQPDNDHPLVVFLRDKDVECPDCAYNLRGLSEPICVECGRNLEDLDPALLRVVGHDVQWENVLISLTSIVIILVGVIPMAVAIRVSFGEPAAFLRVIATLSPVVFCGLCWWRLRHTTQRRLLSKSLNRYDGISWAGTSSMIILAILSIPHLGIIAAVFGMI